MKKINLVPRGVLLFAMGSAVAFALSLGSTAQAGDPDTGGTPLYNKTKVWEDEDGTIACSAEPSNCFMAIKPPEMPNPPSPKLMIGERDGVTIVDTSTRGTYYVVVADGRTGRPIGY